MFAFGQCFQNVLDIADLLLHGKYAQFTGMTVKIASLNAWLFKFNLSRDTDHRIIMIRDELNRMAEEVDVVVFQEVWAKSIMERLIKVSKLAGYKFAVQGDGGLLTVSRLPIKSSEMTVFKNRGIPHKLNHMDFFANKGVLVTRIATADGELVSVLNTHMIARYVPDNHSGSDEYLGHHLGQVIETLKVINQEVLRAQTTGITDILLCGDFNLQPDDVEFR